MLHLVCYTVIKLEAQHGRTARGIVKGMREKKRWTFRHKPRNTWFPRRSHVGSKRIPWDREKACREITWSHTWGFIVFHTCSRENFRYSRGLLRNPSESHCYSLLVPRGILRQRRSGILDGSKCVEIVQVPLIYISKSWSPLGYHWKSRGNYHGVSR